MDPNNREPKPPETQSPPAPPSSPTDTQWSGQPNLSENAAPKAAASPAIKFYNIILLVFVVLVLIEWFFPTGDSSCDTRGCPAVTTLSSTLAGPMFVFSFIAGIAFALKTTDAASKSTPAAKIVGGLVGFVGAACMILFGTISALVGMFRGQPPSS